MELIDKKLQDKKLEVKIKKQDLQKLIDQHFSSHLVDEEYDLSCIEPEKLITHNRLDLAIKVLYLQMKEFDDAKFAKDLYVNHLKAFSLGSFKEPGNEAKNSVQRYLDDFENTWENINDNGVDHKQSIIPLSKSGSIANGAHRVSSAYVLNKKVPVVTLDIPDDKYDFNFFSERGMSKREIETAVTKFIDICENSYVAIIWPSAQGQWKKVNSIIPNVVYQNNVSLNNNGAHNLLSQVYYEETWLGTRENNFPGVKNKLVECFKTFDDLRVIAFQEESLEKVLFLKEEIRLLYGVGKHSVHISDTHEEAIRMARLLFNENSIHFLNKGNPNKFSSTYNKILKFKSFLATSKLQNNRVIIDSSMVLSLYGIRECNDIDYLTTEGGSELNVLGIDNHFSELGFHGENENTLILDDKFYFYFEDLKFLSFSQLHRMKSNRAEEKDINDIVLMDALLENNQFKSTIAKIKQKVYFGKVKLKIKVMSVLRVIGLYNIARSIYRSLMNKGGN